VRNIFSKLIVFTAQYIGELIPRDAFRRANLGKIPLQQNEKPRYSMIFPAPLYVSVDRSSSRHGKPSRERFLEKPNPDLGGAVPMALAISSLLAERSIECCNMIRQPSP